MARSRLLFPALVALLALAGAAAGCTGAGGGTSGDDDDGGTGSPTPSTSPSPTGTPLTLALEPTNLVITLSGSVGLNVTIDRAPGWETASVELRLGTPAIPGISATPVVVSSSASFEVLTLYAAPSTALGGPLPLGIVADAGAAEVTTTVLVTTSDGGL